LVCNPLSPKWPGYCDLLYCSSDNPRAEFSTNTSLGLLGDVPIAPAPESFFCGDLFRAQGRPFAKGQQTNQDLRFLGPFAKLPLIGTDNEFLDGFEYGAAVVGQVAEPAASNAVWIYWTMSTFVPYRVLLMRTLLQFQPGPDHLLANPAVLQPLRDRLDYNQIMNNTVLIKDPLYASPQCGLGDCCTGRCYCPNALCAPQ
jgi:hypothetical protein